jgi:predicted membrane chloride channel (bestrophin family)
MSLDLSAVDTCIQRLRYVSKDMPVESSDINAVTDCLKALSSVLRVAIDGDPLVDELDAILSRIRYVRAVDVIEPDDHNLKVDAIKKVRDILAKMEQYYVSQITTLQQQLGAKVQALESIVGGIVFTYFETPSPLPPLIDINVNLGWFDLVFDIANPIGDEASATKP